MDQRLPERDILERTFQPYRYGQSSHTSKTGDVVELTKFPPPKHLFIYNVHIKIYPLPLDKAAHGQTVYEDFTPQMYNMQETHILLQIHLHCLKPEL